MWSYFITTLPEAIAAAILCSHIDGLEHEHEPAFKSTCK